MLWKGGYARICANHAALLLQCKGPAPEEQDLHCLVYLYSPMNRVYSDSNTKEHKHWNKSLFAYCSYIKIEYP